MNLIYEFKFDFRKIYFISILMDEFDVREVSDSKGVRILRFDLVFGVVSSGGLGDSGSVVVIRMFMFNVSNFKGGIFELV